MMNIDAARRQALGPYFTPVEDEVRKATDIKAGRLWMRPYEDWALPENPTWREDPFRDRSWQSRYHSLLWLDPLRRADLRGDYAAAELWWFLVRSWIDANSPDISAARVAWNGATVTRRALVLACGATVTGDQGWLADALTVHLEWLAEASRPMPEAERVNQHAALFVLGAVLDDRRARDLAVSRLAAQLAADYDEQGVNKDGAIAHHLHSFVWWSEALQRLELEGVSLPDVAERLELASRFLAHATSPLGQFARIGDTEGGDPVQVDHPWARFVSTAGQAGGMPDASTAVYDAGYAFVRSGWGEERPYHRETYASLTWGRQDKLHGHLDGGSVTYATDGVQWIDDAGRYSYDKSSMRSYVVGRESHNTVVVLGKQYRKNTEVRLLAREVTDEYVDLTLHDLGYEDVRILRRVLFLRNRRLLLVLDQVDSAEPVTAEQRWHAGAGVSAAHIRGGFRLFKNDVMTDISVLGTEAQGHTARGQTNPVLGWMSTGWRRRVAADSLMVRQTGRHNRFTTVVGSDPTAAEVFAQSGALNQPIDAPPNGLVPRSLLTAMDRDPRERKAQAVELSGSVWVQQPDVVVVSASGPGEFFAFSLLSGRHERTTPVYGRRHFASFVVNDPHRCRVKIYNRDHEGAVSTFITSAPALPLHADTTSIRTTHLTDGEATPAGKERIQ